ncbi:MAG TPA: hypothetical protein VK612_11570, partial [Pyrinomonadaceae bacterium]|nr:hypothetical protein [Pyrinomonadaceae bacterium]
MRIKFIPFLILSICVGLIISASAQTSVKPSVVTGDVVSISDTKIVLKTKDGDMDVSLSDKTEYKRVPPDNPVLKAAVAATRADIGEGDKLLVTGLFGDDKKTLPARAVYLMTKSDIAQKQSKETERWATRGISGRVSTVNGPSNQVTIEVRGMTNNTTSVVITPKGDAAFKRYAPNSVKYSESVESSITDIKPGDMLRAVGDKNAEGTTFTAEEILTGAFQTVAGTVKTIDTAKNEVVVADAQSKKDVTISLGANTALKRFPEEMATRMAAFSGGGAAPGGQGGIRPAGGGPPQGGQPSAGTPGQGGQGGMRMGGGGSRGGIDDMFERLPAISIADLKVGDMIAVSSSKNGDAQHITAIKLLAGVEPFLRAAQAQTAGGR